MSHYREPVTPTASSCHLSNGAKDWRCTAAVPGTFWNSRCAKKATKDPDKNGHPTKCGTHSKDATAKREAKRLAEDERRAREFERRLHLRTAEQLIWEISTGHNDARGACAAWIKRLAELSK